MHLPPRLTVSLLGLSLAFASFTPSTAKAHDAGVQMAAIAKVFLAALTPEQKAKATFDFAGEERENWHFIPRERKGLPMKEMTPQQQRQFSDNFMSGLSGAAMIEQSRRPMYMPPPPQFSTQTRCRRQPNGDIFCDTW